MRIVTPELVGAICHEVNRVYCESMHDYSQPTWEEAPEWQKASAIEGVKAIMEGRVTSPEETHVSWMQHKLAEGWKWGPVKDVEAKEHPCMVPYHELPLSQRHKDRMFWAIVQAAYGAQG